MNNDVLVTVEGKNVISFLRRLEQEKISLYHVDFYHKGKMELLLSYTDYQRLKTMKTSYQITLQKQLGPLSIWNKIKKARIFLLCSILSCFFFFFLMQKITKVEVIHNHPDIRNHVLLLLKEEGIQKGALMKSYDQIQKMKEKIIEQEKEEIEWLEIQRIGTTYQIRLEERILPNQKEKEKKTNIVATHHAIIKNIEAQKGEIVKNKEDYVKPGDILISGTIAFTEEEQTVSAKGVAYGEVWYHVTVEYPKEYEEQKETGKQEHGYAIKIFHHYFSLYKKKGRKKSYQKIVSSNYLPISFEKEIRKEVITQKQSLTKEEAIQKALEEVRKKVEATLHEKEYIISIKKLNSEENHSKIILETFVSVYQKISTQKEIEEE